MTIELLSLTAFAFLSWLYVYCSYRLAIYFKKRDGIDWSELMGLLHFTPLGLPPCMAISTGIRDEFVFFDWKGWTAITIVGVSGFLWGIFKGGIYQGKYQRAFLAFYQGEANLASSDLPASFPLAPESVISTLVFQGIDAWYAVLAAKEFANREKVFRQT